MKHFDHITSLISKGSARTAVLGLFLVLSACSPKRVTNFGSDVKKDPKKDAQINTAILKIDIGPLYSFTDTNVGSTSTVTATISNDGNQDATQILDSGTLASPFAYLGGSYPGTGGTCGTVLAVDDSCTLLISFSPTAVGNFTDRLDLTFNDGKASTSARLNLDGDGVNNAAILSISDGPVYNYGIRALGSDTDKTFVITNSGTTSATVIADGLGLAAPFNWKGGSFPGTGGDCSATLAVAATCTIVVTFSPTALGAASDVIEVSYNNGIATTSATRNIQGTGGLAALEISDGPTYDFGTQVSGSTTSKSFTVTNSGNFGASSIADAGGLAAPFNFYGGSFPGTGGTCAATLAAAATCTVVVEFSPTAAGVFTDTLDLSYDDGQATQNATRDISGTVTAAVLSISDGPTYDYGNVQVGTTASKTFTVTNSGGAEATSLTDTGGLAAPFQYVGAAYPGTGGTCATSLAPTVTCTLVVEFAPTATGAASDTIDLSYDDGDGNTLNSTRDVSGTGTVGVLTISDGPTYDYGSQVMGSVTSKIFTVTNSGTAPVSSIADTAGLAAPFAYAGSAYPGTGGTCATSLAAAATCTIVVEFSPLAVISASDTIDISYDDGVATQSLTRDVIGNGVLASITISDGPTYDYGVVALMASSTKSFTLTNSGGWIANSLADAGSLAAPYNYLGGTYPGTGGTCGATLAAAATCTVVVEFAPTVGGPATDTLDINYDDGQAPQVASRDLTGIGGLANLTISDGPTYDYGNQAVNSVTSKTFTVTNGGSGAASSIADGGGLAAPYAFAGGAYPGTLGTCAATLAASATCTIVVEFSPTAVGVAADTINLSYDDGVGPQNATRDVTGTGAAATLVISDGATYDYGSQALGSTTSKTFTVTNSGTIAAPSLADNGSLTFPYDFAGGSYPGTGGTCAGSLAAAGTCTVVVEFSPVAAGTFTSSIGLDYDDGSGSTVAATRALTGQGALAQLVISDAPTFNFGVIAVGATATKTFTVTNSGAYQAASIADAGNLADPINYQGGSYPGTGGTCAATLAAGATCTLVVDFAPIAVGVSNASIDLDYDDGQAAQTASVAVTGTGALAQLVISDGPTYNYGVVALLATASKTFTVTNSGGVSATAIADAGAIAAPFEYKGGSYPGTGGTCAATLAAAGTCTLVVDFSPTVGGAASDTIVLDYNDGQDPQTATRDISGIGGLAVLVLSDGPTYDYGTQVLGSITSKTFTVTNTGSGGATMIADAGGLAAPYEFKDGSFPGTGGTCTATLAAAATCTVVVDFAPMAGGVANDTVAIDYFDGVDPQATQVNVTGIGALASLAISDGPTYNYGNQAVASTTSKTFTVTNSGGWTASSMADGMGLAAPYAFKGGSYPGTGGNCGASLIAGGTCTIVVDFTPSAVGTFPDTIVLDYNDGATAQTANRDVTGAGALAVIAISDGPTYDYGTHAPSTNHTKTFTLTNSGAIGATALADAGGLAAPYSFKGATYPGTGGTCGTTLAAAATCNIVVDFDPTAAGTFNDIIDVSYNDGQAAQNATRAVTGIAATATIVISDGPSFDYGIVAVGATVSKTFTATNSGITASNLADGMGLAAPFIFKGGSYPGTGGTCSTSLNAGSSCTVVVDFTPSLVQTYNDTLDLSYFNGVATAHATRDVSGQGSLAVLTISDGPTYNYGSVGLSQSASKTFTVTNTGGVGASSIADGVTLAAPFAYVGGSYPGTAGTCAATLAPAATCTIVVAFSPTASGVANGTVTLNYNDGQGAQSVARNLTGTGALAVLSISDGPTYNYGPVTLGQSASKTFTVTNTGGISATAMANGGTLAAPFNYAGGTYPGTAGTCASTLAAAATCTVVVDFSPTVGGAASSTLTVSYNDGQAAQGATRALSGTGALAVLSISDGPTYDYSSVALGSTASKTFTVTNTGNATASSMAAGVTLAAPFTFKGGSYPGTAGTCAATLGATATCTIVVDFSPVASSAYSSTITVTYNDGQSAQSATRAVIGSGALATLTISDGPTYNYGNKVLGSTTTKLFTLSNIGTVQASAIGYVSGLSGAYAFEGGTFPGTSGDCTTTLNGGATCTIAVTFTPSATGVVSTTLALEYSDGQNIQPLSIGLTGTGIAAVLAINSGPTYNYGSVGVGLMASRTFTVSNTGGYQASSMAAGAGLAAPFAYKGGSYPGTGGTCTATLNTASTCTLVVDFSPTIAGVASSTVSLDYNNGQSAQNTTRAVTGTGVLAILDISDGPTYNYGSIGVATTSSKTFTITNSGGRQATSVASAAGLSAPFTYKGGSYPGTGGTCATTLDAGLTCTIVVDFSPTVSGVASSTININYNDGLAAQTTSRAVTGTGALAVLSISDGPTYDFGERTIGSTTSKTFTITNTGSAQASSITGSSFSAPFSYAAGVAYPGTGGTCGTTLNAGASCTVIVRFQPTAPGPFSATLTLGYYDSQNTQSSTRDIIANGPGAATLTLSPSAVDFGQVTVNFSSDQTVTITNDGDISATSISPNALSAPYSFKGGTYPGTGGTCSTSLASLDSCTIVLSFLPTTDMVYSDVLTMNFNDGGAATSVDLPLDGEGVISGAGSVAPVIELADQTTATGTTASGTINKPTNLAAGDLVILTIHIGNGAPTITPPSGFTHIATGNNSTSTSAAKVAAYYKFATGSEPATYAITLNTATLWRAYANRVTGTNPGSPIGNTSTAASGITAVSTLAVPSIATGTANNLLFGAWAIRSTVTSPVTPSGMTQTMSSISSPASYGSTQEFDSQGSTGTRTLSWTSGRAAAGLLFAIKPVVEEAPGVPLSLVATVVGSGQLRLNWALPSTGGNPDTYYIERALDSGGVPGAYSSIDTSATTEYLDTSPTNGFTYWYRIYAENTYGVGSYSAAVSVTLEAGKPIIQIANAKTATGAIATGVIDKPTNLSSGDLIILVYNMRTGNSTITPPSGFTLIQNGSSGSSNHARVAAYYKIATGSEPATYTINVGTTTNWHAFIFGVTGYDTVTPFGNKTSANSGSTSVTTLALPSINTTAADEVLFAGWAIRGTNTPAPSSPAGMSPVYSISSVIPTARGHYEDRASAGATGTRTMTWTTANRAAAIMFAIKPATW